MKIRAAFFAPAILAAMLLSGCSMGMGSSEFGCEGLPEGVQCKSALDVYELTEFRDSLEVAPQQDKQVEEAPKISADAPPLTREEQAIRNLETDAPIPIRTPSGVMRIAIGPWEDSQARLHTGERVYVEIEQRRWAIGEPAPEHSPRLRPLEVRQRQTHTQKPGPADLSEFRPIMPTQAASSKSKGEGEGR